MRIVNTALPCSLAQVMRTLLKGRAIVIAACSLVNAKSHGTQG